VFARPRHPYTEGLLTSMPQLAQSGAPLRVIPGLVPKPESFPTGCRFHPRCPYVAPACTTSPVALLAVSAAGNGGNADARSRCLRVGDLTLAGASWPPPAGRARADRGPSPAEPPLLEVRGLVKEFPVHSGVLRRVVGQVRAVDGIDLAVAPGETLGLVGESGSGKSTTARLVVRLLEPTAGSVVLDGHDVTAMPAGELRRARRSMQMVFQDPYSSLDPRATIAETVGEPLEVHDHIGGRERDERVSALLEQVGLGGHLLRRYPHEFSGGQRQRIALARALALNPRLVVCDEPVSSLDVSTQSQVINLLIDLQQRLGLTYLFIAHDLSVVRHISDRIAVMYLGRIVEEGPAEEVYMRPTHPYTEALLSAIPVPDPAVQRSRPRIVLKGDVPSPLSPPSGCRFHTRCPHAMDICRAVDPEPYRTTDGTTVACHLHTEGPRLAGAPVTVLTERRTPTAS
jgi:oligopeptide/dipeptide ABC transporter ATP-binding protein